MKAADFLLSLFLHRRPCLSNMKCSKPKPDPCSPWGSACSDDERKKVSAQPSPELNCKTTGFTKALQASPSPRRVSVPLSQFGAGNIDRYGKFIRNN